MRIKITNGGSNGRSIGSRNITCFSVFNDFSQTTHPGNQHGTAEMISNLCNTALGCMAIGLNNQIGRTEILPYPLLGDELLVEPASVERAIIPYDVEIGSFRLIKLPGNQQMNLQPGEFSFPMASSR